MSESPIFAIQKSYYRAKADFILGRTFGGLSHPLVEMFDTEAHAELTLKELRKVRVFDGEFDTRVVKNELGPVFLIITTIRSDDSLICYRNIDQVIARIHDLARSGVKATAEICKSVNKAQKLMTELEDLGFYCRNHGNIVEIHW